MRNSKKILALLLTFVMVFSSTISFAADGYFYNASDKSEFGTSNEVLFNVGGKGNAVLFNPQDYLYEYNGLLYDMADVNAEFAIDENNFQSQLSNYTGQPLPTSDDLEVVSVSAITETTVNVKLNKAADEPLTSAFFNVTGATVTSVQQGIDEDVYVLTVNSLAGTSGTVSVNGVSKAFDFTTVSGKATVENVTLDNYRQLTVKFSAPVDAGTATDKANYYFEIVDGNAGKLGAIGEVTDSYRFDSPDIDTAGSALGVEVSQRLNGEAVTGVLTGKTVDEVTFNFPHTARFGAAPTKGGAILNIKALAGTGTDKLLSENVNVNIAVRNVKDTEGKRSLDTVVKQITIKDNKAPQLVSVKDEDGNVIDITKQVTLYNTATQELVFEFDEPIATTLENNSNNLPLGSKVFVDGNDITATQTELVGDYDKYADSKKVTLNLAAMATKATVSYNSGDQYTVRLTGLRDLSNNLFTSNLQFDLKLTQKPSSSEVTPEILGVEQIADNVFRVEANRTNVTGILTFKEAAGDGSDLEVVMPLTKLVTLTDGAKKYYSYVAVQAKDDAADTDAGILDYEGSAYVYSDVTVNSIGALASDTIAATNVAVTAKGSDFNAGNMKIAKDMHAPQFESDTIDIDYNAGNDELVVKVNDTYPSTWGTIDKAETEWYQIRHEVIANDTLAYSGAGRLSVSYTDSTGTPVNKFVDVTFEDPNTGDNSAFNNMSVESSDDKIDLTYVSQNYELSVDIGDLIGSLGLDSAFLVAGALPQNATYTLQLPESLLSDRVVNEVADITANGSDLSEGATPYDVASTYVVPATADDAGPMTATQYRVAYAADLIDALDDLDGNEANDADRYSLADVDTSVRTAKRGFSTAPITITFNVGASASAIADGVPQTSKEGVSYLPATDELKVLLTGAPTVETMKDLSNYKLNGQTLAELGATEADVTIGDAGAGDTIDGTAADYVVLIKVPAGSIQAAGPANVTVKGISNAAGGTMTPVEVVVDGFEDNTAPAYISGSKAAANVLRLRFNEKLTFASSADASSALQNIEVLINGTSVTVNSMTDVSTAASTIELNVGVAEIKSTDTVVVNFKLNDDNKMEIEDQAGNKLEVQSITDITLQ